MIVKDIEQIGLLKQTELNEEEGKLGEEPIFKREREREEEASVRGL